MQEHIGNGILHLGRTSSEWKSRIIYQILTDRFARTDDKNATCNLHDYCGGTYKGIMNHLGYIKNLGMNAIWISPIVENSPGNYHGYATTNFYTLNTNFGTAEELKQLSKLCKANDIWLMVDLVFNHVAVGEDFSLIYPFNKSEHYHDKCDITDWGNQWQVENCRLCNLPDLKQENAWVKSELIKWCQWIVNEYQIDGIRIDTIKHVPKFFWSELVSSIPNLYMLGEVFDGGVSYLKGYTDIMPGQLSYPLYYTLQNVFAYRQSCYQIRARLSEYDNARVDTSLLGGFIDNHDNKRWLNINGDWKSLKNAILLTILGPSIPIVYYGSEQGYNGGDDPNNREPLWKSGWNENHELYHFVSTAAKQRQKTDPNSPHIERYCDDSFYAFSRGKVLVCTTNQYNGPVSRVVSYLPFSAGDKLLELYSGQAAIVDNNGLQVTLNNGQPQLWVKV